MTLITAVLTASGIIVTADKRMMMKDEQGELHIKSDDFQKVYKVADHILIGFAGSGIADLRPFVRSIEAHLKGRKRELQDFAIAVADHIPVAFAQDISDSPTFSIGVLIAGHDEETNSFRLFLTHWNTGKSRTIEGSKYVAVGRAKAALPLLEERYKPGMTDTEALAALKEVNDLIAAQTDDVGPAVSSWKIDGSGARMLA